MKTLKRFSAAALITMLAVVPLTGCADRTVSKTTSVAPGVGTTTTTVAPASTSTTTYVEKETVTDGHSSVLGTVFDVVGEVIALPFRLVAGIFRFIF